MPILKWPGRPESPQADDAALSALLEGTELPADGAAGLEPVADLLGALRGRPAGDELAGEAAALAQFRQQIGVSAQPRRSRRRRPTMLAALLSAKAAAIAAFAAVSLGGIATAAYAGSLPAPLQRIAHLIIGAPAAGAGRQTFPHPAGGGVTSSRDGSGSPSGPHPAGYPPPGLCTSYEHSHGLARSAGQSAAFRRLVRVAGGPGHVAAFCDAASRPGAGPKPHPTPHPTPHPHPTPGSRGNGNSHGKGSSHGKGNTAGNGYSGGNGNSSANIHAGTNASGHGANAAHPAGHPSSHP